MKNKRKLHVYIVHKFSDLQYEQEHRILGVYLKRCDAEAHRQNIEWGGSWDGFYIAVTEHTARGGKSSLLGLINSIGE